jgi:hypothetical protein
MFLIRCSQFRASKVVKTLEQELSCPAHEEADTEMIFHLCQIDFLASCDGNFANTHCSRHMKLCFYSDCATVNFSHILCGKVNNPCF